MSEPEQKSSEANTAEPAFQSNQNSNNNEEQDPTLEFRKLFIYNLPFQTTKDDLSNFFQKFGKITNIELLFQKNQILVGAFITYEDDKSAEDALAQLHETHSEQKQRFNNHILYGEYAAHQHRKKKYIKRKKLTKEDAHNIYLLSQINTVDAKKLAELDGYSERTYYKIIKNKGEVEERYKHPHRHRKWSDAQMNDCLEFCKYHPKSTLRQIESAAEDFGNPHVSLTTLHSYLNDHAKAEKDMDDQHVTEHLDENVLNQ